MHLIQKNNKDHKNNSCQLHYSCHQRINGLSNILLLKCSLKSGSVSQQSFRHSRQNRCNYSCLIKNRNWQLSFPTWSKQCNVIGMSLSSTDGMPKYSPAESYFLPWYLWILQSSEVPYKCSNISFINNSSQLSLLLLSLIIQNLISYMNLPSHLIRYTHKAMGKDGKLQS